MQKRGLILLAAATLVLMALAVAAIATGDRIGKRRYDRLGAGNDGVYIRKPGDPQAWLARGSLEFSDQLSSWLDRRILDLPEKRIAKVTLTQPDGTRLVISRPTADAAFIVES